MYKYVHIYLLPHNNVTSHATSCVYSIRTFTLSHKHVPPVNKLNSLPPLFYTTSLYTHQPHLAATELLLLL